MPIDCTKPGPSNSIAPCFAKLGSMPTAIESTSVGTPRLSEALAIAMLSRIGIDPTRKQSIPIYGGEPTDKDVMPCLSLFVRWMWSLSERACEGALAD